MIRNIAPHANTQPKKFPLLGSDHHNSLILLRLVIDTDVILRLKSLIYPQ